MGKVPRRRAAPAASWKRYVKTELFTKYGDPGSNSKAKVEKESRWDPHSRFTKTEDLTKFFSGHKYRRLFLIDRENFAKFCIEETLRDHPDDNFKVTGEVMKNEFVSEQSNKPGALDDLQRAIRADGQRDVDNEVPKDLTTRSSKANDDESTQKVSAAAQSIIAASPNSLGPPVDPCAEYLKMTKCGQYGNSNSTIWKSPFIPTLDNTDERRGLLDHQVTAIVWLLSRLFGDLPKLKYEDPDTGKCRSNIETSSDEKNRDRLKGPKYFGGILADSMGLGKTLITVALIDLLIRQKLNVGQDEHGNPRYRPILLITPNATVASQWVQELEQVIENSVLRRIVVSGPGLEALSVSRRVTHLGCGEFQCWPEGLKYMWDENDPRASQVVLIMTMESWASRTCHKEDIKDEHTNDKEETEDENVIWTSSFTKMGRGFSLVIVDEAYKVKNPDTRNWRSIHFLERQFTLLITATPCMNTLTDLFGLAMLLWTVPEKYLEEDPDLANEINCSFQDLEDLELLEKYPPNHDFQLVPGRPGLLAKLLFKNRDARTHDIDLTRKYLKYYEKLAMLKRSPSSHLYSDWESTKPISLEGLFPKVENYTVDISVAEADNQKYQKKHIELLIEYLECLAAWGRSSDKKQEKDDKKETKKKSKKDIKKEEGDEEKDASMVHAVRLLQMASSSLDVSDIDTIMTLNGSSTLAPKVAEMRENKVNILRLAQFLIPSNGTRPDTHVGWMKLVTQNSPVLRYILYYINENILTRKENGPIKKLFIIEQNVMLAFYYELVLQFLGFNCRVMHAQLSFEERQSLVDSFNSSDNNSCQIFIQLFSVGFAGTNLHKNCSRVLVAAQSHSLQVQWQAIYRVIRVGQMSDVTVHRVKLTNSFHTFRESRQIEKILPELGARAQGKTKSVLVRLLNLFQYEIRNAWESLEGQELMKEMNLLEDDENDEDNEDDEDEEPAPKKIKLENGAQRGGNVAHTRKDKEVTFMKNHRNTYLPGKSNRDVTSSSSSKRRGQEANKPKMDDGSRGWYKDPFKSDIDAFLELRTRDAYYAEFIKLPRKSKSLFNHEKNNLRRLLSYGNKDGELSTSSWSEDDLENPAVLERALELMLRVRLGANDIAMLPYPLIDFSAADASQRRHLQRLLAEMKHTDQDVDGPAPVASAKDLKESLRCSNVNKSPTEIEKDLDKQAKIGELDHRKKGLTKMSERQSVDFTLDDDDDDFEAEESPTTKDREVVVIEEDDESDFDVNLADGAEGVEDSSCQPKKIKVEDEEEEEEEMMETEEEEALMKEVEEVMEEMMDELEW
ncbi:P-loop containing nucleoside triphosphate hydrolase protein [Xylaria flabelliformis]|nr:P-loop containing nucleoside triphosphate hydrolase protein [Xylaria flabelliformis]